MVRGGQGYSTFNSRKWTLSNANKYAGKCIWRARCMHFFREKLVKKCDASGFGVGRGRVSLWVLVLVFFLVLHFNPRKPTASLFFHTLSLCITWLIQLVTKKKKHIEKKKVKGKKGKKKKCCFFQKMQSSHELVFFCLTGQRKGRPPSWYKKVSEEKQQKK